MAKGKKYKKWYEKHKDAIESRRKRADIKSKNPKEEHTEESATTKTLVHGFMIYECDSCGSVYQMYLEKGLEDRVQDRENPNSHKPVPFMIGCRECRTAYCKHILWGIGDSDEYEELPENASYFSNDPNEECGKPVINEVFRNKDQWMMDMSNRRTDVLKTTLGGKFS